MALFQRLFASKRSTRQSSIDRNGRRQEYLQKRCTPKLDKSKLRLVIYADSDRGRIPYFDSNAIREVEDVEKSALQTTSKAMRVKVFSYSSQKDQASSQPTATPTYHFQKLGSDVKVLEEMMFGTVAMAFNGSALKVHLLKSPFQLLVTKVFVPEKPQRETIGADPEPDANSLPGSCIDLSSGEFSLPLRKTKEKHMRSIPVDVPSKEFLSDCSTDDDSGLASFTSSGSLQTSFPSPSNNSASSYNSLHRRWMRVQTTALDIHRQRNLHESAEGAAVSRRRRNKLAIGILFGSPDSKDDDHDNLFQSFFFSHFALIEGHVEKLRCVIEKAYFNPRSFLPATMEALKNFRNDVYDLYMAPRLKEPMWLTMMSTTMYRTKLCEKFMQEFMALVTKYDNKNCKFFVSTLLSAVLTQHLAWVATVTPAGGTPSRTYLDKHSAKWVDTLAKTHPYNPLWAQLGDLFGAIGLPLKISRTVVVGKRADVVKRFLNILSYFIRCSDVHENSDLESLNGLVNDTRFEQSLSPSASEKTLVDGCGPDGSSSPSLNQFLTRQMSYGSTGSQTSHGHVTGGAESRRASVRSRVESPSTPREEGIDAKNASESCDREKQGSSCELRDGSRIQSSVQLNYMDKDEVKPHSLSCHCHSTVNMPCNCNLSEHLRLNISNVHEVSNDGTGSHRTVQSDCPDDVFSSRVAPHSKTSKSESDVEPHSLPPCRLSPYKIIESPIRESVVFVNHSSGGFNSDLAAFSNSSSESVSRSQSFSEGKVKSRLSQQLECETIKSPTSDMNRTKTANIRSNFLSEGSNSMFEEYFEPGVEAKTIDDLTEVNIPPSLAESAGSDNLPGEVKRDTEPQTKLAAHKNQDGNLAPGRPTSIEHRSWSITPTELSRRRHLSSTGSIDYEAFDPIIHCKEVKMPELFTDSPQQWSIKAFDRNFGRSLLASYTEHYMSNFVLHGTSDTNFRSRLLNDLQMTVQHSFLDEPVDEAVCVIADTDNWTVEVASSKVLGMSPSGCTTWTSSQMVADLIESVCEIFKLKMSAEFCLMHLEDRLQEIYFKSFMLSEYLQGAATYNQRELTSMLGFESSDMPLLLAIAGTHIPSLAHSTQ